jgi:hypothetical protein
MKTYVHARLGKPERLLLRELREATGESESEIVRRGLRLMAQKVGGVRSALDVAGDSVGKIKGGPKDLSTNPRHLDGFGR